MASARSSSTKISIPQSAAQWFDMIQKDPDIDPARALHVAHTEYKSGSTIRPSEFLHLRAIWPEHTLGVDTFDHYMRDRIIENSVYRGYVSEENDRLAAHICNNLSRQWTIYKEQIEKGRSGLASDPKAGVWAMVRFRQAMVTAHTKKPPAEDSSDSDDSDGDNVTRIVKDLPLGSAADRQGRGAVVFKL
ncbi:hypothetical protein A9K55_007636 [Cordyceps militaris]|uniref:Uncharacterized protein n=1 Tax=Cordyceps militaris TaxID=73501 RepID=A0A2H4SG01_CORMI|nr:hypothetical protein A9K55_007636 [Cordyceps militaris]